MKDKIEFSVPSESEPYDAYAYPVIVTIQENATYFIGNKVVKSQINEQYNLTTGEKVK